MGKRIVAPLVTVVLALAVTAVAVGQMGNRGRLGGRHGMGPMGGMGQMGSMHGMRGMGGMGRAQGGRRAMQMHAPGRPIGVMVNGRMVRLSLPVMMLGGQMMVPMRDLFASLGSRVQWQADTRTIAAEHEGQDIRLSVGRQEATVNGESVRLDAPPRMYRGSVYVPLRFVSESLGATVRWDPTAHRVAIATARSRAAARAVAMSSTSVARGGEVYTAQNCAACHRINGQGGTVGPNLSHVGASHSKQWLEKKVETGGQAMPAFKLSAQDLNALGDYLASLRRTIAARKAPLTPTVARMSAVLGPR